MRKGKPAWRSRFQSCCMAPGCPTAATPRTCRRNPRRGTSFLHGVDKSVSCPALHDGLRHGTGHDGIVREKTVLPEQGEVLRFDVIPLIDRAYNIANNCTNHLCPPFFSAPMQGIFFTSMFKIYHEKEREGSLTKRRRCKKGLGIILSPLYLILEKQQETEWVDKKADEIVL